MSVSTTPTSDPSPVQAILSEAETGGFSGSGRVERHAIARGDGGRVRAARLVIDVGSPVPDELPGLGFALGLSPLPRREGVRLRPQAAFRISRRCFEFGKRTDIRSTLPVSPDQARSHQLVIEDAAIGEDDIGHRSPVAVYVPRHDLHDLTEDELRGERFGPAPEVLADLGADNAVQANLDGGPVLKDRDGIAVRNTDNLPRELFGRGERDPRDDDHHGGPTTRASMELHRMMDYGKNFWLTGRVTLVSNLSSSRWPARDERARPGHEGPTVRTFAWAGFFRFWEVLPWDRSTRRSRRPWPASTPGCKAWVARTSSSNTNMACT